MSGDKEKYAETKALPLRMEAISFIGMWLWTCLELVPKCTFGPERPSGIQNVVLAYLN